MVGDTAEVGVSLFARILGHAGNLAGIGYYLWIALQGGKVFQ